MIRSVIIALGVAMSSGALFSPESWATEDARFLTEDSGEDSDSPTTTTVQPTDQPTDSPTPSPSAMPTAQPTQATLVRSTVTSPAPLTGKQQNGTSVGTCTAYARQVNVTYVAGGVSNDVECETTLAVNGTSRRLLAGYEYSTAVIETGTKDVPKVATEQLEELITEISAAVVKAVQDTFLTGDPVLDVTVLAVTIETMGPTTSPTTKEPTAEPTVSPSTRGPTRVGETFSPTTVQPTNGPTTTTVEPTPQPTAQPTFKPTAQPTFKPTAQPTASTDQPTGQPTAKPTALPTGQPTAKPTALPTGQPTSQPTITFSGVGQLKSTGLYITLVAAAVLFTL